VLSAGYWKLETMNPVPNQILTASFKRGRSSEKSDSKRRLWALIQMNLE